MTILKFKRIRITDIIFEEMLFGTIGPYRIKTQLPKDIKIVNYYFDDSNNCWWVIVKSEQFKPIDEGEVIPIMDIVCKQLKSEKEITKTLKQLKKGEGLVYADEAFDEDPDRLDGWIEALEWVLDNNEKVILT